MNVVTKPLLKNKLLNFPPMKRNTKFLLDSFVNLLDCGLQCNEDFMIAAKGYITDLVSNLNEFERDVYDLKFYIAELELAVSFFQKNYELKTYLKESDTNDVDDFDLDMD